MRIDEPDFGCEGRPDGVEPIAKVTLLKLKSEEEIQLEIPDAELYRKEIVEERSCSQSGWSHDQDVNRSGAGSEDDK